MSIRGVLDDELTRAEKELDEFYKRQKDNLSAARRRLEGMDVERLSEAAGALSTEARNIERNFNDF